MRPVIDFLNNLDGETDVEPEDRELNAALIAAPAVPIERLPERATFSFRPPTKKGPTLVNISYKKSQPEADKLKRAMGASSYKDLGLKTFEYTFDEVVEEEKG